MRAIDRILLIKEGAKKTKVHAYVREREGKVEIVRAHTREAEEDSSNEEEEEDLDSKKGREMAMWRKWNTNGRKHKDLRPLMKSLEPMIHSRSNQWKGRVRHLSDAAIDLEFKKQALAGLKAYDPDKGAALGTFVYAYMEKAKRMISQNQNMARIPENRIWKISEFQRAQMDLEEKLGKPANDLEMSGYLKWSLPEVVRMSEELNRGDLWTSLFEEDPTSLQSSRNMETLKLIRFELSEDERKVHALIIAGTDKPGDIATKTGFSPFKVSRIKKNIATKMAQYV